MDTYTTTAPAARRLGLSADYVRRLVDRGALRAIRTDNGQRLIVVADLDRLVAEREERARR